VTVPFTVVDDTTITFVTPEHAPGPVDIVLTHPGGTVTVPDGYEFLAPPAITSLTPSNGPTTGGTEVIIRGSGFTGATGVTIGGVTVTEFEVLDDGTIRVVVPPGPLGPADVVVQHPFGDATAADAFTYRALIIPSVTGISPDWGPTAGGTQVRITGSNLDSTTSVTFDGTEARFQVLSSTELLVWAPAHAVGAVALIVSSDDGSALPFTFTYVQVPDGGEPGEPGAPGAPGVGGSDGSGAGTGALAETGTSSSLSALLAALALLMAGAAALLSTIRRRLLSRDPVL